MGWTWGRKDSQKTKGTFHAATAPKNRRFDVERHVLGGGIARELVVGEDEQQGEADKADDLPVQPRHRFQGSSEANE